jgi:hypothetical protein
MWSTSLHVRAGVLRLTTMTAIAHPEVEQTRALWRQYRKVCHQIGYPVSRRDDGECVGRVIRLLRKQYRLLGELLGESKGEGY